MKKLNVFFTAAVITFSGIVFTSCATGGGEGQSDTDTTAINVETETEAPMNALTEEEKGEDWILMFDGESTDGWRNYNSETFPEQGWHITDEGYLMCMGSGHGEAGGSGGDIIYDEKFQDFKLSLEWKISEGGNSGIFYLAKETTDEPIWKSALEMQILDNEKHPDAELGKEGNRQAGSLYDLIPADPQNANPAGEWNSVEIMVYQGTVVHKMNGATVLEYHLGTSDWEEMVNNSKFAEFEEFGKYREGYIGLQDHGNDVWFRNIKIKRL